MGFLLLLTFCFSLLLLRFSFIFNFFKVYIYFRERMCMSVGGGAEGENLELTLHWAWSLTWAKPTAESHIKSEESDLQRLSHPGAPFSRLFNSLVLRPAAWLGNWQKCKFWDPHPGSTESEILWVGPSNCIWTILEQALQVILLCRRWDSK